MIISNLEKIDLKDNSLVAYKTKLNVFRLNNIYPHEETNEDSNITYDVVKNSSLVLGVEFILEDNKVEINNDDLLEFTKSLVQKQMQQYGQATADEKQILDISENILKNEDERKKISNQLFDEKTLVVYKEIFKLIEKPISYDDFVKLATEK